MRWRDAKLNVRSVREMYKRRGRTPEKTTEGHIGAIRARYERAGSKERRPRERKLARHVRRAHQKLIKFWRDLPFLVHGFAIRFHADFDTAPFALQVCAPHFFGFHLPPSLSTLSVTLSRFFSTILLARVPIIGTSRPRAADLSLSLSLFPDLSALTYITYETREESELPEQSPAQ